MTQSDPTPPPPSDPNQPSPIPPPPEDTGMGAAGTTPSTPVEYESTLPGPPVTDPNARTWGMFAHLSGLAGFIIPFGSVIGPLIVWMMKKEEIPFVDDQG